VHWGCYNATARDIEVDPQRRCFGCHKSDFALQRLVECRALETERVRLVALRWHITRRNRCKVCVCVCLSVWFCFLTLASRPLPPPCCSAPGERVCICIHVPTCQPILSRHYASMMQDGLQIAGVGEGEVPLPPAAPPRPPTHPLECVTGQWASNSPWMGCTRMCRSDTDFRSSLEQMPSPSQKSAP
jgi:hypothetical protein